MWIDIFNCIKISFSLLFVFYTKYIEGSIKKKVVRTRILFQTPFIINQQQSVAATVLCNASKQTYAMQGCDS